MPAAAATYGGVPRTRTRGTVPITGVQEMLVARVRQARRCRARRTDGQPCRAWAIVGGTVCRAHGGAARQVRHAAERRALEADLYRAFADACRRWAAEVARWEAERVAVTAELLDVPAEQVDTALIVWCQVQHGRPALWETRPTIATVRRDRRLRANRITP